MNYQILIPSILIKIQLDATVRSLIYFTAKSLHVSGAYSTRNM